VILPLTLIASVWGMNVSVPGEDDTEAFWLIMGGMVTLLTGMIAYFRRRGWL
jgi:magnesium transporter